MYDNRVPDLWAAKAYPSLKPLSTWVVDLLERCRFISGWIAGGCPSVYWISGFFFPQVGAKGGGRGCASRDCDCDFVAGLLLC